VDAMIVRVGNSRGIRIPKPLIEEAGLGERVALRVVEGGLLIEPRAEVRPGWADAAREGRERDELWSEDRWPQTRFDTSEWEWVTGQGDG